MHKSLILVAAGLLTVAGVAAAQTPPAPPAPPAPGQAAPPPPPDGGPDGMRHGMMRHGPMGPGMMGPGMMGPGMAGPGMMHGPRGPRGAHFVFGREGAVADIKCADTETMRACVDAASALMDKLAAQPTH